MIFHEKIYNSCKTCWVFELLRVLKHDIRSIHRPDDYLSWRCLISVRLWFTGVWIQVYLCTYLWFVTDFFPLWDFNSNFKWYVVKFKFRCCALICRHWKKHENRICVCSDHVKQLQNIRLNSSVAWNVCCVYAREGRWFRKVSSAV